MSEMDEKVEEPQEQAADGTPIPPEQLKKILEAHRKWVESEGKEGERADLFRANLQNAILFEATLGGANLQEADLIGAEGLTAFQVGAVTYNWALALYDRDFLEKLGLPPDHNEQVKRKLAEIEKEKKATDGK